LHLHRFEVWIQIDDTIADNIIRGDVAVHQFDLQTASIVFVLTVDIEGGSVFELGVLASLLNDFSLE